MCNAKQIAAEKGVVETHYNAQFENTEVYSKVYYENGYEFKPGPVITIEEPSLIQYYKWGLVPAWEYKEEKIKSPSGTLNCRSEEMYEKDSFRDSLNNNFRCIVIASGFYENHWNNLDKVTNKTPFKIFPRNKGILSFAGLYSVKHDKTTGRQLLTYTILTTEANKAMSYVHNNGKRMPVILSTPELERAWIDQNVRSKSDILDICKSMPEDYLDYYTISKKINQKLPSDDKNNPEIEKLVTYRPEEIDAPTQASLF